MLLTDRQIKNRLDKVAAIFNQIDDSLKARYGKDAYIYVEAEGHVHAMNGDGQDNIIVSSKLCNFDCGAW